MAVAYVLLRTIAIKLLQLTPSRHARVRVDHFQMAAVEAVGRERRPPGPSRPAAAAAAACARLKYGAAECLPELERHDVVEDRVDDGADVVEDAGDVVESVLDARQPFDLVGDVEREEPLSVERRPADEERDDDSHYETQRKQTGLNYPSARSTYV